MVVVPLLLTALGFVAGGFTGARLLVDDNAGLEGGATVFLSALAGAAVGLILSIVLLRSVGSRS